MNKFIVGVLCIILVSIIGCNTVKAQNVKREGKTFIQENKRGASSNNDIATTFIWKDNKGNEYPIFLHKYTKGEKVGKYGAYVVKVSTKTGKEYKYYIPNNEEITTEIVKELNI